MEGWAWAIILRPLATLALFAAVVIPLELVLRRVWPEGALKRVLFDRTFRDRRPALFTLVWLALMVALWTWLYFAFLASE